MNLQNYLEKGFKSVGNIVKDPTRFRRNGDVRIDITWNTGFNPVKKRGVYVIVDGYEVIRIGETLDMDDRFECYTGTHTGPSNVSLRQSLEGYKSYGVYFFELPVINLTEDTTKGCFTKGLLTEYKNVTGKLPKLNKVIR